MEVTATELKNRLGKYLDISRGEPVIVDKTGRKTAVLLSYEEYKRLTEMEDAYWAQKAIGAEQEGYVGTEKSLAFLKGNHA
ncbi:MAG: type II toxin-antitoxin system Phd/YefM family antitoxin [Proteobacteria bacterium]|nr:type II toxin-antitoxin system Phd/YefM family antitoxin [Pseudomonadota bacterium]MBU1546450.1 type II toxin-antitoxin system Phd/YefM family antitoxin [Pseudomonadota bacterium]MBU2618824.1 type II toxin-antitoxin system Phd/YefM family antitoxin [Pseudomonadota bacterium]